MSSPVIPVTFDPIFKPKPWGGRSLERLFGKPLAGDQPIGESWEISDLPGNESRVASGPLAGTTIGELIEQWGDDLVGSVPLVDGRFPLLIKFLDAREHLSVQVHPKDDGQEQDRSANAPAVKHEAWYVLDADPGAALFIGLKDGVGPDEVAAAVRSPELAKLLRPRAAKPGRCYFLPSGVPHALGAGVVVAEIQTPSDVTYRLYDWDRVGLDGKPRDLHIDEALANIRYDVPEEQIVQPRRHSADALTTVTRAASCERFLIDHVRHAEGVARVLPHTEMLVWIVLSGNAGLSQQGYTLELSPGDVALIPAGTRETRLETHTDCAMLEVSIPIASGL